MKFLRLFLVMLLPAMLVLSSCSKEELLPEAEEVDQMELMTMVGPAGPITPQQVLPDLIITQVRTTLPPGGPCPVLVGATPHPDGTGNVTFVVGVVVKNDSPVAIPVGTQIQVDFAFSGLPTVYTISNTLGLGAGQSRTFRRTVSLTAATGTPIGLGTRNVLAHVDRIMVVNENNDNNNTDNGYQFCDDI